MTISANLALCLVSLLAVPMTQEEKAGLPNMFLHMQELQAAENAKPPAEVNTASGGFTTHRTFPFEAYDHLNVNDLMRAVKEGIEFARVQLPDAQPDILLRHELENVQFVLEFFPIIATDRDAFDRLEFALENYNEEYALRLFLMRQFVPGESPSSLLQRYLLDLRASQRGRFQDLFGDIIIAPQEVPQIRELAMEALWHTMYAEYRRLFEDDANVEKHAEETGAMPSPRILLDDPPFELTNRTNVPLRELAEDFQALASLFGEQLDPNKRRAQSTQDKAREMLQRLLEEIALPNPDAVRALLVPGATPSPPEEQTIESLLPPGMTLVPVPGAGVTPTPGQTPSAAPPASEVTPAEHGTALFENL